MFKKLIFITAICLGSVLIMQQNCTAQSKSKDKKNKHRLIKKAIPCF